MPALKGPKPALDFGKAGQEGLPRPGNPEQYKHSESARVHVRYYQQSGICHKCAFMGPTIRQVYYSDKLKESYSSSEWITSEFTYKYFFHGLLLGRLALLESKISFIQSLSTCHVKYKIFSKVIFLHKKASILKTLFSCIFICWNEPVFHVIGRKFRPFQRVI